ncbi:IclR family transcriptional regulator [Sphingobium sp. H39-3-25]|jgi:DNA-binding IclR family transcriptional regulator|uniref:IclR family transcriptional regulator n=1 Tax=Sphingomonadales TaxID=204457 RepID=UPI00082AFD0D|nr:MULTISPECIES: IclR family transcriptional regulator [Sphingomonadaceae]MDF0488851.1 IclR family transcriptional regulator [Sphingomonas pollutisoli]MDF0546262.1 IclR family transcriptional regulator [Sphingobium arseniciresistens]
MTIVEEESAPKRRAGIQSVEIGLNVLDALAGLGKPSALSAIVHRCGLSPSQTHRYLVSLIVAGMARQDAAGNYDLGPAALRLGLGALARTDVFQAADTAIAAFVEESGRTVQMAALGPHGPTVVRWHVGSPPVVTSLSVGSMLPLLRSATGHVFLAFLSERETRDLVTKELAADKGLKPVDVEALRKRVRAAGESSVDGTVIPGLRATAFPIFDLQSRPILSATMLSSESFEASRDRLAADRLRDVCLAISAQIGGKPPAD